MVNCNLKLHKVIKCHFADNVEMEQHDNMPVHIEGGVSIPYNFQEEQEIKVKMNCSLGKENTRIYMFVETISVFEITNENLSTINEDDLKKECSAKALTLLRKTIKEVTGAFGRIALDLPVFDEERLQ